MFELGIEIPGPGGVDRVLDARLLGEHLVHLLRREVLAEFRVDLVEPREERPDRRDAFFDVAQDVLRRVERRLLRQEADGVARGEPRLAQEVRLEPGHDAQQRRLAGAVRADDADLRAIQERQPDVLENDRVGRVNLTQPFHRVNELRHVGVSYKRLFAVVAVTGVFGGSGVKSSPGLMKRSCSKRYCLS